MRWGGGRGEWGLRKCCRTVPSSWNRFVAVACVRKQCLYFLPPRVQLRYNQSLAGLKLGRNSLCGVDEYKRGEQDRSACRALAQALKLNKTLRSLDLSGNPGADALASSFEMNAPNVAINYRLPVKKW